jgi:hypothetical protein
MDQKRWLFLGIPLAGALLLAAAAAVHRTVTLAPSEKTRIAGVAPSAHPPTQMKSAPHPAPPEVIARATDQVRLRGTYQNFRRAVASQDSGLQKAILPSLLHDRDQAVHLAEEDLARATTDLDRDVARQVISVLRK